MCHVHEDHDPSHEDIYQAMILTHWNRIGNKAQINKKWVENVFKLTSLVPYDIVEQHTNWKNKAKKHEVFSSRLLIYYKFIAIWAQLINVNAWNHLQLPHAMTKAPYVK